MDESQIVRQILQSAKKIRQTSRTSCVELENYLYYQYLKLTKKGSSIWTCGMCARPRTQTKKQFRRAFNALTKVEQAEFYLLNVKNVQRFLNTRIKRNDDDETQIIEQLDVPRKSIFKIKMQIMDDKIFKKFTFTNTQTYDKQKIIRLVDVKEDIDLHHYILRKSKNINCLALQSMHEQTTFDTVRLMFKSMDFEDSLTSISKIWSQAQYENIKKILIEDNKFPRKCSELKTSDLKQKEKEHKSTDPLIIKKNVLDEELFDSKKLRQSRKIEDSQIVRSTTISKIQKELVPLQLIQSLNSFQNFEEQSDGIYFEKHGNKVRKTYQFSTSNITVETVKKAMEDLKSTKKRKSTLISIRHLNSIPSERTNIYREINSFEGNEYEFLYFQHYFCRKDIAYFFEKFVNLEEYKSEVGGLVKGVINYCIWRIVSVGSKIELLVEADISYNKPVSNPQHITALYIGDLSIFGSAAETREQLNNPNPSVGSRSFENDFLSEISGRQVYYTVTGSMEGSQRSFNDDNIGNSDQPNTVDKPSSNVLQIQNNAAQSDFTSKQTTASQPQPGDYLKHRYQMVAQVKGVPRYLRQDGHALWGNLWKISSSGDLVNLEKEKIKIQSSVLKLVLQRMGKSVLSGKGIMGLSLPIQIFGIDSNLERIARGYIYAPIFLEKAALCQDPVQRMKFVFCFGLGFSIGYIKMEKPFNPVLGQTYQGQVDGCPVYGEQISHHPPISSMLMIGRGYRVYGNFEMKVELGMNYASGINEGYSYVEFVRDNVKLKFNTPPGEMHGIIMGERKLALAKKSYYIDEGNRLMCEISWGKNKNSRREESQMRDFFSGKIVKLKNGSNLSEPKKIKPKDIELQYGEIHGRFTGKVYYDNSLIFDVGSDAPLVIENYTPCLESDSRNRRDIKLCKLRNYQLAQQAKEEIEQAQRNDKKLRKN